MSVINQIHFFNKLRRHIGIVDAIKAYISLRISKSGLLNLSFLNHPFHMRIGNRADMETFNEVFLRKAYDVDINFTPKTIIDAGANIGMTSVFYASKYPNAQIISIEPDNGNFALLKENTSKYKNITCMQAAIWHTQSTLKLIDIGRGDNSFVVHETGEGYEVKATTIRQIMHQHELQHIDILKIDIEGAEKQIFSSGFEQWLPMVKVLIIEIHTKVAGTQEAVLAAIEQYNFAHTTQGANHVFYNNDFA